jgi:hypothetical protein
MLGMHQPRNFELPFPGPYGQSRDFIKCVSNLNSNNISFGFMFNTKKVFHLTVTKTYGQTVKI